MSVPNEGQACKRCGQPTPSIWARYCDTCEAWFERQDALEGRDDEPRDPDGAQR